MRPSSGRTGILAVLNATPDSFSDGDPDATLEARLEAGLRLASAGADAIDVGGESTRPGSDPTPEDEEARRVLPLISALVAAGGPPISIDTRRPALARAGVGAGAQVWNDVSALGAPGALETAAELGCQVVLMHMQGAPRTMQIDPRYDDVVEDVRAFLLRRADAAAEAGVEPGRILLDPGIGFGKTLRHNLELLAGLPRLVAEGYPVVLGASRKGFIGALDPSAADPRDRLGGSLAAALVAAKAGCAFVRVHDVAATRQALAVQAAVAEAGGGRLRDAETTCRSLRMGGSDMTSPRTPRLGPVRR